MDSEVTMNNTGINMNCVDKNTLLEGASEPRYRPSSQVIEIFERNGLTRPWGLSGAGVRLGSGWVRMSNHAACSIELLQHHYPDMDEKTRVRANASMLRLSELWNV